MPLVKSLLRKLINEEIKKLEEQSRWGKMSNQDHLKRLRKLDAEAGAAGGIANKQAGQLVFLFGRLIKVNKYIIDHFPNAFKALKAHRPKFAAKIKQKAAELQGGTSNTANFCANPDNDNKDVPGLKGFRCSGKRAVAQSAEAAKAAGAKAEKGASKGKKKKKARKDILVLQALLKKRFGKKINLGRTGKNKDGVDGVYGGKTQRAINLLRKTDGGPKRQANFTKSIAALIAHLKKGAAKGPSPSAAAPATTLRGAIPMQAGEQGGGMGQGLQEGRQRRKNKKLHGRTRRLQEGVAADVRSVALFVRRLKGGKCGYDCREAANDLDADAVNRLAAKGYIAKAGLGIPPENIINAINALKGGKGLNIAHQFLTAGQAPDRTPTPAKKREPKIAVTTKEKPSAVASGKGKRKWNTKCRCAKFGCKTKLVGWIQDQFGIKVDNKFGKGTRRTVIRWQKKNGLKPDGIVCPGGNTEAKLKAKGPQDLIGMEKVKDLTDAEAAALEKKRAGAKGPITGSARQYRAAALKGIYQVTGRRTEENEERARDLLQSFWPSISKAIANKEPEVTRNGEPSIVKIHNYARELVQAGWSPSPTTAP